MESPWALLSRQLRIGASQIRNQQAARFWNITLFAQRGLKYMNLILQIHRSNKDIILFCSIWFDCLYMDSAWVGILKGFIDFSEKWLRPICFCIYYDFFKAFGTAKKYLLSDYPKTVKSSYSDEQKQYHPSFKEVAVGKSSLWNIYIIHIYPGVLHDR